MTDTVITFTSLLALAANAASLVLGAALIEGPLTPWAAGVLAYARRSALGVGALVASVATVGSLYFSEGAHFIPCELCWYQRILMYPLAVILIVAAVRRDLRVRPYALTLALIGLPISVYHYLIEHFPSIAAEGTCDLASPCTAPWFWKWDFITLAYMAGSAFLMVILLLLATLRASDNEPEERAEAEVPR